MKAATKAAAASTDGLAAAAARIADELQRAKDNLSKSASDAGGELGGNLRKLQDDLAGIQQTMADFSREARVEAAGAASRIGAHASGAAYDLAEGARETAQSAVADFEDFTRRNPQVVLGAALGLGVVIGMFLRRR